MPHEPMIHIVDDDEAVRRSLRLLMQSENIAAQTYKTAEEFLEQYEELGNCCLLLDVRMPGMSGLELMNLLQSKNMRIPIVFITGHGDINMAVEVMKKGATDFIEKPFDSDRLLRSISLCLNKAENINHKREFKHMAMTKVSQLTSRERQVMDLVAEGKQNKIIARNLNISPRTVELHRSKVMHKLEADSLSDVVRIALVVNEEE